MVVRSICSATCYAFLLTALGCASEANEPRDGALGPLVGTDGSGTSANAVGGAGMGGGSQVGYAATVQPFVKQACNCHRSEPFLMAPFSLKDADGYANLVDAPSMQVPSMMRVAPGDTAHSYLWHKINGTQASVGGSGQIMPSTIPLNADEKAIFERWINAGAPP
jgi:hypothetical protein